MNPVIGSMTECPVCMEKLANPKFLPCHHTFCCKCIQKLCSSHNSKVPCPVCRSTFDTPSNGRCSKLPTNAYAEELVRETGRFTDEKRELESRLEEITERLKDAERKHEAAKAEAETYKRVRTDSEVSAAESRRLCDSLALQQLLHIRMSQEISEHTTGIKQAKEEIVKQFHQAKGRPIFWSRVNYGACRL